MICFLFLGIPYYHFLSYVAFCKEAKFVLPNRLYVSLEKKTNQQIWIVPENCDQSKFKIVKFRRKMKRVENL